MEQQGLSLWRRRRACIKWRLDPASFRSHLLNPGRLALLVILNTIVISVVAQCKNAFNIQIFKISNGLFLFFFILSKNF